jgi:hypothetical protein
MHTRMDYDAGVADRPEPASPMPTKPLDRLLFVQGGLCFFCKQPLPRDDASIEHLHAIAKGGANGDDNCVACCKAVNTLLGSMSVKQKFEVVLNQQGQFRCPNIAAAVAPKKPMPATKAPVQANSLKRAATATLPKKPTATAPQNADRFALVVANLETRGNSRPRTIKTLTSTVTALFPKGISKTEVASIVKRMQANGTVKIEDEKVTYKL